MSTSGLLDLKSAAALTADIADLPSTIVRTSRTITAGNGLTGGGDVSARVQELTATAAVTAGVQSLELNHASTIIAATIASTLNHPGLFIVKDTSATGTAAHTVTITTGTWNGTNKIITLNALNEAIAVYFDSAGNGTILVNVGSVALSG